MSSSSIATEAESIDVKASSAVLQAAAFLIGEECAQVNDMFMACKRQHSDPVECAEPGLAVSQCVQGVFRKIQKNCQKEFEKYWKCLDLNNQMFMYCRGEEESFYGCTIEKMGIKKKLWKGRGPEDGFKEDGDVPAKDSLPYRWHVFQHKRQ